MTMDRLPAPNSDSKLHRPASGRIGRPASARAAAGPGPAASRRTTRAAVAGASAVTRLLSEAGRAQHPAATGAGRSQVLRGRRDTLQRWLQSISATPGVLRAPPVRDAMTAAQPEPSGSHSREDRHEQALVLEDLDAPDPGTATVAAPATAATTAALDATAAPRDAERDAPRARPAWEDDVAAQHAPWRHAETQRAALAALAAGTASREQRDFLIAEIRRQVPDVAYLAQSAVHARTVLSLIIPGNRELGLKTLNDHVVGYQINNSMIGPRRNQAVKNAFVGARGEAAAPRPFTVTEQTYKLTTVTSPLAPPRLRAPLNGALQTIDRNVPPIYESGFTSGLRYWSAEHDRAPASSPDRDEAARRMINIQSALVLVRDPEFRLDFQFGLAEIKPGAGDGPSIYPAALTAHMQSSQAALMRRDPDAELASSAGDSRGLIYDREAFLRFCRRGEALRGQVIERGNELTHHGHTYRVFPDQEPDRDVLRDVRKDKIKPDDLAQGQDETLSLFERYFVHANAFDSIRPFASTEVARIGAQIERAQHLIDRLQGDDALDPNDASTVPQVLHDHPAIGEIIPTIDTASEAVFYNAERTRTHRIILSCDVQDMGVDVVQSYARAMHRVGGEGEDPDLVALQASDRVIEFRREAIARTRKGYSELVAQAIDDARRRGDLALAEELEAERQPSLLMGGDELTLSVHDGMRPYVPRLAAVLMDPDVARARVAISTTGGNAADAVDDHILAQQRADPAHSVLKDFEAALRDLERTMDDIRDPERKAQAAAWLRDAGLGRLYAENEGRGIVLRRNDTGEIVEPDGLRQTITEVMQWSRASTERRPARSAV
jgi:hypothetical protein